MVESEKQGNLWCAILLDCVTSVEIQSDVDHY